jgi:hypothetical protein
MPLAPMRLLKQLLSNRMACQAQKSDLIRLVEKSEYEDFSGKIAYFLPPALEWNGDSWSQQFVANEGIRISFVDVVIGVFYFEKPIPPEVKEDWILVIRDCFVDNGGTIAAL